MSICADSLPLSLYVHLPWCVKKCPYCDFNSHEAPSSLPETSYVDALIDDLERNLELVGKRSLVSIFFGGGTPSLFSGKAIESILNQAAKKFSIHTEIEITLEANPGTIDQVRFKDFKNAGINRLSLGIQSFQDDQLHALGRIHNGSHAKHAIQLVKEIGFTNFNLDLMYGLPQQSISDAIKDLKTALSFQPSHLSWYQLTIEPNTLFAHQKPVLPKEDEIWDMQMEGFVLLNDHHYQQYEVSAFAQAQKQCIHNRNYWEFGDYLGIGAGAHSKITTPSGDAVRFAQVKHPRDYLNKEKRAIQNIKIIKEEELIFEFMLNALRLTAGVPVSLFEKRTGLIFNKIEPIINEAIERGLLLNDIAYLSPSELGKRFLNDLTALFL